MCLLWLVEFSVVIWKFLFLWCLLDGGTREPTIVYLAMWQWWCFYGLRSEDCWGVFTLSRYVQDCLRACGQDGWGRSLRGWYQDGWGVCVPKTPEGPQGQLMYPNMAWAIPIEHEDPNMAESSKTTCVCFCLSVPHKPLVVIALWALVTCMWGSHCKVVLCACLLWLDLKISMWIDKSCFSYVQTDDIEMLITLLLLLGSWSLILSWWYLHLTWWWVMVYSW
jgi:hypothetical protein